jgi:hypothetical protein
MVYNYIYHSYKIASDTKGIKQHRHSEEKKSWLSSQEKLTFQTYGVSES